MKLYSKSTFRIIFLNCLFFILVTTSCSNPKDSEQKEKPNIIVILTDDQGYGDLACHGNPVIKTPHIDSFHDASIRLSNFHVNTVCTPTRAALLTGKYPRKVGIQGLLRGYSLMRGNELTMPEIFKKAGYSTALFGKWHLGDNYPFRPQDQGFDEVLSFNNGGLMQFSDFWGNDYFDDTYLHNGVYEKYNGYCTDVWFTESMKWVKQNKNNPFFLYLSTNAPHDPLIVASEYSRQYQLNEKMNKFYGMITNLDDNMGKLLEFLKKEDLEKNTILIFMTDNGSTAPRYDKNAFNGGQKGGKYSLYDGGHRVPFFIRWPNGGFIPPGDIDIPTAHIDILPTLMALSGIEVQDKINFDGFNLSRLFKKKNVKVKERTIEINNTFKNYPTYRQGYTVVNANWRLLIEENKPNQLFNIKIDPMQDHDISVQRPDIVQKLIGYHNDWLTEVSGYDSRYEEIEIGSPYESPSVLGAFDWHAKEMAPASQNHIKKKINNNGWWAIKILKKGNYSFRLRHWPDESEIPVEDEAVRIKIGMVDSIKFERNMLASATQQSPTKIDTVGRAGEAIILHLEEGSTQIKTWLGCKGGGANFVHVTLMSE